MRIANLKYRAFIEKKIYLSEMSAPSVLTNVTDKERSSNKGK